MDLIDLEIKRTEHRAQEEGINPSMVAQKALEASQGQVRGLARGAVPHGHGSRSQPGSACA